MNYTRNGIYTRIAEAIEAAESGVKCYSRYTEIVEKFPAAFIYPLSTDEPQRYRTLAGDSEVLSTTFEVQLFSNLTSGAEAQTKRMSDAVLGALRAMHFRITSARPVLNNDPSINRFVIRASRLIGGADEMPSN